jgi:hypothetical protein
MGQYLQPTAYHLPVDRWVTPDEFEEHARVGEELGLAHVEAGPLVRSSYHAGAQFRRALDASAPGRAGRDQALSGYLNRGLSLEETCQQVHENEGRRSREHVDIPLSSDPGRRRYPLSI